MNKSVRIGLRKLNKAEEGLTLLEYAAGAAFILATAAIVMLAMRTGMQGAFTNIGTWLENTTSNLDDRDPDN